MRKSISNRLKSDRCLIHERSEDRCRKDLNLDGVDIKRGPEDGWTCSLQYARFRMDEQGDFGRVRRQQQVMNAIFSQLKNPLNLIRAPYAAGKALGYTSTDVTAWFLTKTSFDCTRSWWH